MIKNVETQDIPEEHWRRITDAYSTMQAVEQKGDNPISARTVEYQGYLHTVFGIVYCSYGKESKPSADGYRLLPESIYDGETTTVYHDDEAIRAGLRERGDHTGLIVSVKGRRIVCAKPLRFQKGLPGTLPMSLSKAEEYDQRQQQAGWRALFYKHAIITWHSLNGHPVVCYSSDERDTVTTLFWIDHKGEIHEMNLDETMELSSVEQVQANTNALPPTTQQQEQLVLFS